MQDQPFTDDSGGELTVTSPGGLTPDLAIGVDPGFSGPNLTVPSGTISVGSGLTIGGGGITVIGGANNLGPGSLAFGAFSGGNPPGTQSAQIQIFGTSAASMNSSLTMTGSGRVIYVSQTNTSTTLWAITPTASASTSGTFQDGAEVTVINFSPSGTSFVLSSAGMGSITQGANVTISAGQGQKFLYNAPLQAWVPII